MKTAIVTDSNCGILRDEAEKLNLFIVPMPICIENTFYYEGIDLSHKTFLERLRNHEEIHTSQPSPADLMIMWERVLAKGYDELVYIPMSGGLSGAVFTACQTAEEFSGKVHVADARRISVTQRHAVLDALWLAGQGVDAAGIKKQLEKNASNSVCFVAVDDLDYLKQGGRITPAAAAVASVLGIRPLLVIGRGRIDIYEKVRGQKCCEKKLLKAVQEKAGLLKGQGYDVRIGITASFLDDADLAGWQERAQKMFPDNELVYDPFTCSISSHVGPNAFGMGISAKITSL
ncbi:MAG: DegV family protein [bacterium]|nr:DegV family protein [bacterium]MCM1561528.1 DegV family protein [Butyrivibrio sp.]